MSKQEKVVGSVLAVGVFAAVMALVLRWRSDR